MGQNCAGPERFFVYEKVYDEFIDGVVAVSIDLYTQSIIHNIMILTLILCKYWSSNIYIQSTGCKEYESGALPWRPTSRLWGHLYGAQTNATLPETCRWCGYQRGEGTCRYVYTFLSVYMYEFEYIVIFQAVSSLAQTAR